MAEQQATEKDFEQFEQKYKVFSGLATEPKINYYESGKVKTTFAITLKKGEDTLFLNCVVWGKLAENIAEDYKKGDRITVMGYFQETEYNDKKYLNFNVMMAS